MLMQFQLTASRRGWLNDATKDTDNNLFQLTASRRGWQRVNQCSVWVFNISTHSLTKRLTINDFNEHPINLFQLTASRRGWRQRSLSSVFRSGYFNSQPHEEADGSPVRAYCNWNISTHSLTKRLTERRYIWLTSYMYFNSQPHEEADPYGRYTADSQSISTHSLTKRLTWTDGQKYLKSVFQLTASRRGWRQTQLMRWAASGNFNSQPHEEADGKIYSRSGKSKISTHSLTKRLTCRTPTHYSLS